MTPPDRTPTTNNRGSQPQRRGRASKALAWTETALLAVCLITALVVGLTHSIPLAIAIASLGAATTSTLHITIAIHH